MPPVPRSQSGSPAPCGPAAGPQCPCGAAGRATDAAAEAAAAAAARRGGRGGRGAVGELSCWCQNWCWDVVSLSVGSWRSRNFSLPAKNPGRHDVVDETALGCSDGVTSLAKKKPGKIHGKWLDDKNWKFSYGATHVNSSWFCETATCRVDMLYTGLRFACTWRRVASVVFDLQCWRLATATGNPSSPTTPPLFSNQRKVVPVVTVFWVSWNRGTPSHDPFLEGSFPEINPPGVPLVCCEKVIDIELGHPCRGPPHLASRGPEVRITHRHDLGPWD